MHRDQVGQSLAGARRDGSVGARARIRPLGPAESDLLLAGHEVRGYLLLPATDGAPHLLGARWSARWVRELTSGAGELLARQVRLRGLGLAVWDLDVLLGPRGHALARTGAHVVVPDVGVPWTPVRLGGSTSRQFEPDPSMFYPC